MQKATFAEYAQSLALELSAYQLALVHLFKEKFPDCDSSHVESECEFLLAQMRSVVSQQFLSNPSQFHQIQLYAADDNRPVY